MIKKIEKLIVKYITKSATSSDLDKLSEWVKNPDNEQMFKDYIQTHYAITYNVNNPEEKIAIEKFLGTIKKEKSIVYRLKRQSILKYAAAAVLIGILTYYSTNSLDTNSPATTTPVIIVNNSNNNVETERNKATLTLEDGTVIDLEKNKTYQTDRVNSTGKELVYKTENTAKSEVTYNYLTIPRGGQFYVKLSDGTEVWLNSESQLKYPVAFIEGISREVELVYGEAYFDVSPSTDHQGAKFKVVNQNQEVEVFGTEFNIKAYKNEDVITTLVEGKVTVSNSFSKQNLLPNQQSKLSLKNKNITINQINVYSEISWKKGIFSFKSKSLKEIMTTLSRWYDVDILFTNTDLEKIKFNGVLSKQDNVKEILETIKNTNFINAYEITKNKIIIK
ncbi:FecR domain-containing protein [Mariniflexile litorale]|uniref:FecR domain-containing protein n=1 Tax=Mariniflexile litorale TaxID=3045158 RepID=A0AAU7EKY7_9FLAO|nr:FecR domain-containing protein [Mariniflexile sp. KMM 9835]MDQ8210614.1 DUF4974 domain-containing protein [Mariniflexile sp. KMM 9835]